MTFLYFDCNYGCGQRIPVCVGGVVTYWVIGVTTDHTHEEEAS